MKSVVPASIFVTAMVAVSPLMAAKTSAVVWPFTGGPDGYSPRGDLILVSGIFYGTSSAGGATNDGAVYQITPGTTGGTETAVWNFTGGADGSFPNAGVIADSAGNLFGTTELGATNGAGAVYRLTPPAAGQTAWTENTLWNFTGGVDGGQPTGALIFDQTGSGTLFGTTRSGGTSNAGTVFRLDPPAGGTGPWTETVIWSFTGGTDGAQPLAGLYQNPTTKVLFGTASIGGSSGAGVVFQLSPPSGSGSAWTLIPLWSPTGGSDGAAPTGSLIADTTGALYGTTKFGGNQTCPMAGYPYYGEPNSDTDPALNAPYVGIGANGCGVVFKLTPPAISGGSWTQSVIWSFTGAQDGGNPVAGLVDVSGVLYGLTPAYGSAIGASESKGGSFTGSIYALTPPSQPGGAYTETNFPVPFGQTIGTYARGNILVGPGGKFYCTASYGGPNWVHHAFYGNGSVMSITK